jgi:hypothetical protein
VTAFKDVGIFSVGNRDFNIRAFLQNQLSVFFEKKFHDIFTDQTKMERYYTSDRFKEKIY